MMSLQLRCSCHKRRVCLVSCPPCFSHKHEAPILATAIWQVATFLEANGRGYWEASDDVIDRLRQLYTDVEDRIEGVE